MSEKQRTVYEAMTGAGLTPHSEIRRLRGIIKGLPCVGPGVRSEIACGDWYYGKGGPEGYCAVCAAKREAGVE